MAAAEATAQAELAATQSREVHAEIADAQARLPSASEAIPTESALAAAKGSFSTLKRSFLNLQERQGFLESVVAPDAFGILNEEPENTEETIREAKRANKGVKEQCGELTDEIRAHTAKLDELYNRMEPAGAKLKEDVGAMEAESKAVGVVEPVEVKKGDTVIVSCSSVEEVKAHVAEAEAAAGAAASRIESLEGEEKELSGSLAPLKSEVEELEARAAEAEADAADKAQQALNQKQSWTEMTTWYSEMATALEALGGVAIKAMEPDGVLRLNVLASEGRELAAVFADTSLKGLPKSANHELVVRFSVAAGAAAPESATLIPANVPVDDIVSRARATGDVKFLIREVASRVQCYAARKAHIDVLRRMYVTSAVPMGTLVTFSLPAGVAVTLRLTHDYPRPTAGVHIERLDGVGGWRATALERVRSEFNARHYSSGVTVAQELQAHLAAMEARGEGFVGVSAGAMSKILGKLK